MKYHTGRQLITRVNDAMAMPTQTLKEKKDKVWNSNQIRMDHKGVCQEGNEALEENPQPMVKHAESGME